MEGATQLASIVGQLVGKEYRQLSSVGGQVAELSDELETMNAILRMVSDAEESAVDHFIRVWMKQVRELAYDAEDCIHLYVFRIRCRQGDRLLVWSKRLLSTLFPRRRLAREIDALRARAVVISDRHARYGVSRDALSSAASPSSSSSSSSAPVLAGGTQAQLGQGLPAANDPNQHLVGIAEQADMLAEMVSDDKEGDRRLKVFSIVGFGGLGKTTLAMQVCRQLETEFQRQAQVSVSQAFGGTKDLEGLLKRVLRQIVKTKADNAQGNAEEDPLHGIDAMTLHHLTDKLDELLKDTRYLIMIDDIWTVATQDAIISKLPDRKNGSRIIVTTRSETVAEACSDDKDCIHRIKYLSFEDSKKLFLSRAFGSKDASCPSDLEEEMGKILKKCGGLPMAIISIAGLLASHKSSESTDMWERVRKSIGSQMENHPTLEGMKQIVTLSYNHLHYYLKGCLMYLSIFPEDYIVVKNRLLKRWIAEGLVGEIRGLTPMEVAEAYYNELVSRSMIDRADDIVNKHEGRFETCRVHDMIVEVMVSKSLEANFVSLVGGPYEGMSYGTIRRLSIHSGQVEASMESGCNKTEAKNKKKFEASQGTKNDIMKGMNTEHVRSLSMFDLEEGTQKQVLDRLGEFNLLRVLDLEDCIGMKDKHLKHVCRMYLLKFLSMKGTSIKEMPQEVGELENLETLDVRETYLVDLPANVSKLEKLQHVQINNKHDPFGNIGNTWIARRGLGRMKALRMVNAIVFGCDEAAAQELGGLEHLRELRLIMDINDPDNPHHKDVRKKLAESLSKLYSLRWLIVIQRQGKNGHPDENVLNFLHDINPPPRLLQYLSIYSGIDRMPDWVGTLNNLVEMCFAWTYFVGDQLFSPICKLPKLKYLRLDACYYKDPELLAKTDHTFPALKYLFINFNIEGMEVVRFQENAMTELETLSVSFWNRVSKRLQGLENLSSLKEVQLAGQKGKPALDCAVEQLKTLNEKHQESNQIKVAVQYE